MRNISYDEEFLRRHKNFEEDVWKNLQLQNSDLVKNCATKEARLIHNQYRQICGEAHRFTGFTRFNISKKGILYAIINPEHFVEDMVARFFHRRFPKFAIIINSKKACFSISPDGILKRHFKDLKSTITELEEKFPNSLLPELINYDAWETFYNSQNIPIRKNKRYQSRVLPKKYMKDMPIEKSFFDGNKTLTSFMHKK